MGSSKIAGEIYANIEIDLLATMLEENGIRVALGDSSQYAGGTYIRVEEGATDFTLEKIEGEYLVRGDASSVERMYEAAILVSFVLTTLDICHGFEIYNESIEVVHHLHHNSPQEHT
jgi:hypothetical protein